MKTTTPRFLVGWLFLQACIVTSWHRQAHHQVQAFVIQTPIHLPTRTTLARLSLFQRDDHNKGTNHSRQLQQQKETKDQSKQLSSQQPTPSWFQQTQKQMQSFAFAMTLGVMTTITLPNIILPAAAATTAQDSTAIVSCLFQKCAAALGQCIANPACLANVICINSCTGKPDEINCQIECGNLFENNVVGVFNKCAISDMACVPQQPDEGLYPVPPASAVVPAFDTARFFDGRWYITAGQNPLFDIFPCQVHFFTSTNANSFFAKLNWRIEEPDGEFFTRDALQEFVQDAAQPGHLVNDDNEYLHYSDDWWILDYEYDNNADNVPPFALVYYRGSNDAWDGYGGAVVYTRAASLPESLLPRLRTAAAKVHYDFDRDFTLTDNSCPAELSKDDKLILRERFAGNVALQTEQQLQAAATRFRGTAANSLKAQKLFFENRSAQAQQAFNELGEKVTQFEKEVVTEEQKQQP